MSGSGFNSLYSKDVAGVAASPGMVLKMIKCLSRYENSGKVVRKTLRVIKRLNKIQANINSLSEVWKVVEWQMSGDYSTEQVQDIIDKFNDE